MNMTIARYLHNRGPCLTSDVANYLIEGCGLKPATARKQVSRAGGDIKRLSYITFPKRVRFLYLEKDQDSPIYWRHLIKALLSTKSAYGHALAALSMRDGIMPAAHFQIACGAPLKQAKHLTPNTILDGLHLAGLVQKEDVPGLGECVTLGQSDVQFAASVSDIRARLITETVVLAAVRDWLRNLGIVSYDKVATRDGPNLPKVGTFAWDLSAPSYLSFMLKKNMDGAPKPGFVACDILLGQEISKEGLHPFINKCKTLRSLRNVAPCMQIFVANSYSNDAFIFAKQNGIIPATPSNLFGKEVAEGLTELTSVLKQAAETSVDPEAFDSLFKKLGKIEGASHKIRGTLFEFLVAQLLRNSLSSQVTMNRLHNAKINGETKKAEADVVCVNGDISTTFVECKGYSPYATIPDKELLHWIHHQVPVLFKAAREHPDWKNHKIQFEFWATGELSEKVKAVFDAAKSKVKPTKYSLELKLGDEIYSICQDTNDKSLIEAFKSHYMKK